MIFLDNISVPIMCLSVLKGGDGPYILLPDPGRQKEKWWHSVLGVTSLSNIWNCKNARDVDGEIEMEVERAIYREAERFLDLCGKIDVFDGLDSGVELNNALRLHLRRGVMNALRIPVKRIYFASWMMRRLKRRRPARLVMRENRLANSLKKIAEVREVELIFYGKSEDLPGYLQAKSSGRNGFDGLEALIEDSKKKMDRSSGRLGFDAWQRAVSLNQKDRSVFFNVPDLEKLNDRFVVYNFHPGRVKKQFWEKNVSEVEEKGIRVYAQVGARQWQLNEACVSCLNEIRLSISGEQATGLDERANEFFIIELDDFVFRLIYWMGLFAENNICINYTIFNAPSCSQVAAMKLLDGVTVASNYTMSNRYYTSFEGVYAGEDVQFNFNESDSRFHQKFADTTHTFVHAGYLYDGAGVQAREESDDSLRNSLKKAGANFILCFFEEGSQPDEWNSILPFSDYVKNYKFLIRWLDSDPTLGLLIKLKGGKLEWGKRASTEEGFDRGNAAAMDEAFAYLEKHPRAHLIYDGYFHNTMYPSRVALQADMCVGELIGGTACLEASLCGVRSVLIDKLRQKRHRFRQHGLGKFVFRTWEEFRGAVNQYRQSPESFPDIGLWPEQGEGFDFPRDGKSGERIWWYTVRLWENLQKGMPRQAALNATAEEFDERWGKGMILCGQIAQKKN